MDTTLTAGEVAAQHIYAMRYCVNRFNPRLTQLTSRPIRRASSRSEYRLENSWSSAASQPCSGPRAKHNSST